MRAALCSQVGQSITETVIFLPVLLILFLGITYLKELTDARARAVEAARYVTWEGVWYVRGLYRNGNGGQIKDTATLTQELKKIGLGRNLIDVKANMSRSLGSFVGTFDGGASTFSPKFLPPLNPALQVAGFAGAIPGEISNLVSLAGPVAYALHDFVGRQTLWDGDRTNSNDGEIQNTIYTAKVTYGFQGAGLFRGIPRINIVQFSSIVSHPYNLERADERPQGGESTDDAKKRANQTEYDDMFGPAGTLDCTTGAGHIFDLWLFPTGPLGSDSVSGALSAGLSTVKCVIADIGKIVDFIPLADLGFKQPDGTLKSYPELEIQDP